MILSLLNFRGENSQMRNWRGRLKRHSPQASQHARCPLGSPPSLFGCPWPMPVVSPSQDGRLLPWRARKDWDWACPVPSGRNPPILAECLLFSFSPALSPLTSLFTTSPFSFPPPHTRFLSLWISFAHQWECEGRIFRPRIRTTPKTTTTTTTRVFYSRIPQSQASTRLPYPPRRAHRHDRLSPSCKTLRPTRLRPACPSFEKHN